MENLGSLGRLSAHYQRLATMTPPERRKRNKGISFRRRRVLGNRLGAFRDRVLRELTRENQSDRGLNLSRRDGRLLVVGCKLGGLGSNTLEDVIDERVQNRHGTVRDTGVRVHLLEHFVDVGRVGLLPRLGSLLLLARRGCRLFAGLLLLGWCLSGGGLARGRGGLLLGSGFGSKCYLA